MIFVLLGVAAILLLITVTLYWRWPKLIFSPVHYDKRDAFHAHPERFEPLQLVRQQNVVLEGIVYSPKTPECTVLYFGGKEQDSVALVGKLSERFSQWRIVAFNYRGYGTSGGTPSESALLEDAVAETAYVKERFGDVVLMGYSLGSSMAAFAASRTAVRQLVLVAPFYDIASLAKTKIPLLPGWLVRCHFDTARYLGGVRAPVRIFASRDDRLVPIEQSRALKAKVKQLLIYKEYSGYDHAEILFSNDFAVDVRKVY